MRPSDQTVKDNYLTPAHPTAFSGIQKVYDYYEGSVPLNKVKKILSSIDAYTLQKEYKDLAHTSNPTYVHNPRQQFQMDIAFVTHLAEFNDGYMYLLVCIDVFTKFAFVRPLKTKRGPEVLDAFKSILKQANELPTYLVVDRGTEFTNQVFTNYCRSNNIKLINNYTSVHAPVAERFIRSLKRIMGTYLQNKEHKRYIDDLQKLVRTYNLRKHRSIGLSPYEGEKPSSSLHIRLQLSKQRNTIKKVKPKLKVGDYVRISLEKNKFSRGHDQKSSNEIFIIYSIKTKLQIPMYYLKDMGGEVLLGGFYAYQLTVVPKPTAVNM